MSISKIIAEACCAFLKDKCNETTRIHPALSRSYYGINLMLGPIYANILFTEHDDNICVKVTNLKEHNKESQAEAYLRSIPSQFQIAKSFNANDEREMLEAFEWLVSLPHLGCFFKTQ